MLNAWPAAVPTSQGCAAQKIYHESVNAGENFLLRPLRRPLTGGHRFRWASIKRGGGSDVEKGAE